MRLLPGAEGGERRADQALRADGAHAGAHGGRVIRVGGVAEEDQSGAANRVERAEDGADVAGVLRSVEGDPA